MKKITFPAHVGFKNVLKERVDQYFDEKKIPKTGNWRMFLKTTIILLWLAVSYVLLLFFSANLIMAIITAFLLAQGFVLVGFNIMHDGNHGSYSRNKTVNWIMGFTLDLIGGSHIFWKQKHNILHHTYTNIEELDNDLQTNGLIRLSPEQKWRPWHRFQHWYAFPAYSMITLAWIGFGDFQKFFTRRIGAYRLRRPNVSESFLFFLTKIFYVGYMLVLPMFFNPVLHVILAFLVMHIVLGLTMSVVFQLAHTVEGNEFPAPNPVTREIENEWAIHQVETTADFAPGNKWVAWYLGGLNYQIEHHLFSKICHIHYPEISKIVKKTCEEYNISYVCYPTVRKAIAVHFNFLKKLGFSRELRTVG